MSCGIKAWSDRHDDYARLCKKYNVKLRGCDNIRGWSTDRAHYDELTTREEAEQKARTDEGNRQNVNRYLAEATVAQLQAELKRRGK